MMTICEKLRDNNTVTINQPQVGTYVVINKYASNYRVSGCIKEELIDIRLTSESELWEFTESHYL